jgi:Ni,Fe-hydrogenase maturation factor
MIFPQLGPQYYDEQHKSILSRMEAYYATSITIMQAFWSEADTDTRYFSGDQTFYNDLYGNLPANRRRHFNFNRIRRVINMISGHQRRNRKSTIVTPVENGDDVTADQFTKIMLWVNNQESVLETISEAFEGALITGLNFLQVWIDYRSDPVSGNIKVDKCDYNSFLMDPFFKKHDLSDCNYIWKRSFMEKREVVSLMPDKAEEIMNLHGNESGNGRDGKFQFMPESYNYGLKNLLTYDEFYYRDYRWQKMLVDSQTGETMEWRGREDEDLKLFLQQYPTVTVVDQEIPTVKLAVVVQGKVLYDGPNLIGTDCYPFVPVFAYYHPEIPYYEWKIQGVVRGLRDAQFLYNRRRVIELDILESQINSGWKYKEDALVNPKDIFLSGQGRGLALKQEAQMTDVEQIIAPAIPESMIQLSELLAKEVSEISGVNEELLGSAMDDKAGVLSMLRQGAGLTTLQILFDQLDHSQKLLGRIIMDIIQQTFAPGKVKKIIDDEPSPQFYSKAFGRYDCVIEDGLNTATQKQMQFAQMLQLREAGVPITPEDLLEAATIQNKKQIIENMQRAAQAQQQQQQQQAQLAMQEQQANIELVKSTARANDGLGMERISRIEENKALANERMATAAKDHDIALFTLAKTLKEIQGIDLSHIDKLIEMAKKLEQENFIEAKPVSGSGSSSPQSPIERQTPIQAAHRMNMTAQPAV